MFTEKIIWTCNFFSGPTADQILDPLLFLNLVLSFFFVAPYQNSVCYVLRKSYVNILSNGLYE